MKMAQWIANNVWIQFNISLLRVEWRNDKLQHWKKLTNLFMWEIHGFSHQFPIAWENATKPIVWENMGNW